MLFWDDVDPATLTPASAEWEQQWRGVDKVIYSRTLTETRMRRAELRAEFDVAEVARWKADADAPIGIGGRVLASEAARAGLLDEIHLMVAPVLLGGGTPYLDDGIHVKLELLDERRSPNGWVYLRYAVRG